MRARSLSLAASMLLATSLACAKTEFTPDDSIAEANMAVQRQVFDAVAAGNLDAWEALIGPGYVFHGPSGQALDWAATRALVTGYLTAFPDLSFSVDLQTANDEYSIVRVTATGTNTGELMGAPATGKSISASMMNIMRIADGKIIGEWENSDELGMMGQLGLIPQQ